MTIHGRTLDERMPRACPYQCPDARIRLLLDPDEDIRGKLDRAESSNPRAVRGYRRLLDKIGRDRIGQVVASGDAMEASAMIREALLG